MNIEDKIENYITSYFSTDELKIMKQYYFHDYGHDDTQLNNLEYIKLTAFYKKLAGAL